MMMIFFLGGTVRLPYSPPQELHVIQAMEKAGATEHLTANTDLVAAVNAGVAVRTVLQGLEGLECDGPECAS